VSDTASVIDVYPPSLTQQSQAEEADINTIVRRFGLTGHMPQSVRAPTWGDFDGVWDYRTALEAISEANNAFMEYPAAVRARFENDPAQFVDFCSDPANLGEMASLGLAIPRQTSSQAPTAPIGGSSISGQPPPSSEATNASPTL